MQRLLPVANSRLLEVHRGTGQQAVVHCSFAAIADSDITRQSSASSGLAAPIHAKLHTCV